MATSIKVASVIYNLAGEETKRTNFLRAMVIQNILTNSKTSMTETFLNGYRNGPATRFRNFFRWAKSTENYGEIGMPNGEIVAGSPLNPLILLDHISHSSEEELWIQWAVLEDAEFTYWAEQWIWDNRPADINTAWVVELDESTGQIKITFVDTTTHTFTPTDFDSSSKYIFARYVVTEPEDESGIAPDVGVTFDIGAGIFPSGKDWTIFDETAVVDHSVDLAVTTKIDVVTVRSYSDGRPDETVNAPGTPVDSVLVTPYQTGTRIRRQTSFSGPVDALELQVRYRYETQDAVVVTIPTEVTESEQVTTTELSGGVTRTTTVTTTTTVDREAVEFDRSHRTDTKDVPLTAWSGVKMFIYRIGSGNPVLDALADANPEVAEFYPFIPIRHANKFLSETYLPNAWAQTQKAYKKALGVKLPKLIELLSDNEKLADIDNAYIVFGVSLNAKEKASLQYIYNFFDKIRQTQSGGPNIFQTLLSEYSAQEAMVADWLAWVNYTPPLGDGGWNPNPEPPRPVFSDFSPNQIKIIGSGTTNVDYDTRLSWNFVNKVTAGGLGKIGAKRGDCWIEYIGKNTFAEAIMKIKSGGQFSGGFFEASTIESNYKQFRIYWQRTNSIHDYLDVIGAYHRNFVYKGKSIFIDCQEAIEDEDESGFIVPLHDETWREMSIVNQTQMSVAMSYIQLNCYVVKKLKWYQTGIFRILLVIVIAIVSVIFTGGAGFGLLGAHLAVGTALGFSGMMAAIIGAAVNALAGIILSTIVQKFAGFLGPLGQLLAALFMLFVGNIMSSFQTGGSFAINWANMLRVDNILALTDALGKGLVGMLQADTVALGQQMVDFAKKAEDEARKIQEEYFKQFGYGAGEIDPLMFVDNKSPVYETSDTFLTRTLLTGSEIAEMTREMLYSFTELSIKLPDALT